MLTHAFCVKDRARIFLAGVRAHFFFGGIPAKGNSGEAGGIAAVRRRSGGTPGGLLNVENSGRPDVAGWDSG